MNVNGRSFVRTTLAALLIACLAQSAAAQSATLWTTSFRNADSWHTHPSLYGTIEFPDVNGDGRADVCGRGYAGIYCALALSNGAAFGPTTLWSSAFSDANGWHTDPSHYETIQFPDVNGDGKSDVCGRSSDGIYCARSNGTAFVYGWLYTDHFSNQGGWHTDPSYWATIRFPDINGDGWADVCGRGYSGIECGISWGSYFSTVFQSLAHFSDPEGWNGDPSYWSTIQFPDVNGDGRADVCGRGYAGMWCALKKADYTTQFHAATLWEYRYNSPWPSPDNVYAPWGNEIWGFTDPSNYATIQFADLNNDGKDDVCARVHHGISCYLASFDQYAGSDGGFQRVLYYWGTSPFWDQYGWNQERCARTIRLVDINGDGLIEACGRGNDGIYCQRVAVAPLVVDGQLLPVEVHDRYVFAPLPDVERVVANFGDNYGWGTSEAYWKTVQFADVDGDGRAEACGRGSAGIWCGPTP